MVSSVVPNVTSFVPEATNIKQSDSKPLPGRRSDLMSYSHHTYGTTPSTPQSSHERMCKLCHPYRKVPTREKTLGEGLQKRLLRRSTPDFRHWGDPNVLCDRLRLLIFSKQVGNTRLYSKIISILEELQEAGFIKDYGNIQL